MSQLSAIQQATTELVATATLSIPTEGPQLTEFTREASRFLADAGANNGTLFAYLRHTSASLLIQENAASAARRDLEAYFSRIAPEDPALYTHNDEGPDDMPAHLRSALTQTQLSIPVGDGRMALGTWQGIYLFEHRREPSRRQIALHLLGA